MTRRARALLVLALVGGGVAFGSASDARADTAPSGARRAYVFLVHGATLGDLLTSDSVRALARAGGAGWMAPELDVPGLRDLLSPATDRDVVVRDLAQSSAPSADAVGDAIRTQVPSTPGVRVLVVVIDVSASPDMVEQRDDLRAVVVADAPADRLYRSTGPVGTMTSDSTRRTGVVASPDAATTVQSFLGRPISPNGGHRIRIVGRETPPFELHRRYLAMRRMTVPVQTAAALYVTVMGLFAVVILRLGRRAPAWLGVVATGAAVSVGPLAAALLEAGRLPSLSYATVVPFVVVVTAVVTALVLLGATRGLMHPVLPLGVVLLGVLLVEDLLGWGAALTPFLGGSQLDGGRFFGLPNVFIGLLLGASLYAAARLPVPGGFAILVGAALLAGLPFAGANLGGAVTLFAGAGLWLPLRARGRLGWRELAFAVAVVVAGTALILVAHRFSSVPTHVTAFERNEGAGGAWSTFVDRLGVGWRLIVRNPFALVPVVGMLVTLAVVVRPPALVGQSLARHPEWRTALLVLLLTSVVAYVVNDSGAAACGVGFGMGLGGLLYVSVAERTWKMVPA